MFTIGIDANVLTRKNRTGTERYVYELLTEMMKNTLMEGERVLLYSSAPLDDLGIMPNGWSVQILNWIPKKAWTHARLSWELIRRTPNLFFTPAHEIPAFHGRTQIVSTVHDVAFRKVPGVYTSKIRKRQEWAVGRAIKESSHIITVSETTKADLLELYNVQGNTISATPLAVRRQDFTVQENTLQATLQRYGVSKGKYFVTIGRIEDKKNISTLVKAFEEYKRSVGVGDSFKLFLGGTYGRGGEDLKKMIDSSPARSFILTPGYVPEEDLAPLVAGSAAYVFPSWYEGFGIPALEAFAAGTVLIASDIPALHEVAGNAAVFADPKSVSQWADKMIRISSEEISREEKIAQGSERLEMFSWATTASKTWEVLRSFK
ncbi:MAG: glycosyltransferase family 1 protein [Candidatus Uhrbacteria bacterium]|nr:glycosyltransferase family 1 protein [Candidatus Uhrbacteria bacterium]